MIMCETEIIIMVRKALTCFNNILLNEYTIAQSDKVSTTKIAKKISKISGGKDATNILLLHCVL